LGGPRWEAVKEVWGAFDAFGEGDEKYSTAFGRDIIASIPPGSIYFGGTDAGRFIVTALCRSQVNGDPFFVLTQTRLADNAYLDYLQRMYGDKLNIPDASDSRRCYEEYAADVERRSQNHQLLPGEREANGKVQVTGSFAMTQVDGMLVKVVFDKNPKPEFFIEESFPFEWMYPQLEPHGLIFKLDRQPLTRLPDEVVQNDHVYWAKYVQPMIGDWLNDDAPVAEVAAFAGKTFGRRDFGGFTGDRRFIQNAYAHRSFSKLRSSIAGLYAWRVNHAAGADDQARMAREADFAFRQAWALCPDSPEALFRYVNFLVGQRRMSDALLVAQTAAHLPAMQGDAGGQVRMLVEQLKKFAGNGL
jgi:hypothetical protein